MTTPDTTPASRRFALPLDPRGILLRASRMGRVLVGVRAPGALLERIGPLDPVAERADGWLVSKNASGYTAIDPGAVASIVTDVSETPHDTLLTYVDFLAADGASVAFTYGRSSAEAEKLVAEVTDAGGKAVAIQADSADAGQVAKSVDDAVAVFPCETITSAASAVEELAIRKVANRPANPAVKARNRAGDGRLRRVAIPSRGDVMDDSYGE